MQLNSRNWVGYYPFGGFKSIRNQGNWHTLFAVIPEDFIGNLVLDSQAANYITDSIIRG